tara:strand:- start:348 stop:1370 length:1023 start_codon:yes stop_codon:yes gene_type:complete
MQYLYKFDKSSKKYMCPQCQRKTFVRYVNIKTGELLNFKFGRCDREKKCGHIATPKGDLIRFEEIRYTPPSPTSYHSYDLFRKSKMNYKQNKLVLYLRTIFSHIQVQDLIEKYSIGTSKYWPGATVFWQVDDMKKIRHGKIMLYNEMTGKRAKTKSGRAYISSVRAILKLENFNLKQCLFGLHLVNEIDCSAVAIVESEKTAMIMSVFKPEYLWLATGSKSGFKYEYLYPLKTKKIIAFPDKGEYSDWLAKAVNLNNVGFNITVSQILENTEYSEGFDLADAFIEKLNDPGTSLSKIEIPTVTEMKVMKLAEKKPEIWKLIDTFDLEDHNGININRHQSL